jgi:hypothetical protein
VRMHCAWSISAAFVLGAIGGLPFNRANHGDWYGLGLSIVAAITTAHGGTLDLHAPPERGLRARVELASRPSDERFAFTQVNRTGYGVLGTRSP